LPVEDRWLSVDDLREYLGVSRDTIYDWLNAKNLPGHKVGRLWKFKREEIDEWVRAGSAAIKKKRLGNKTTTSVGINPSKSRQRKNKGKRQD